MNGKGFDYFEAGGVTGTIGIYSKGKKGMKPRFPKIKKKDIDVYEHLDHVLQHTTYADRWQWLVEANAFVRAVTKAKFRKPGN